MAARTWALLASLLLLSPGPARSPACPSHLAADDARERAIFARLAAEGVSARGVARVCFGAGVEAGIMPGGVVQLDVKMQEIEAVARVAHLVEHAREGAALAGPPPPGAGCPRWVEQALDEEAHAYALEMRILARHGARPAWPFAERAAAAPEAEREAVIGRWLRDHPDGGGGVPSLARGYAARCEEGSR